MQTQQQQPPEHRVHSLKAQTPACRRRQAAAHQVLLKQHSTHVVVVQLRAAGLQECTARQAVHLGACCGCC